MLTGSAPRHTLSVWNVESGVIDNHSENRVLAAKFPFISKKEKFPSSHHFNPLPVRDRWTSGSSSGTLNFAALNCVLPLLPSAHRCHRCRPGFIDAVNCLLNCQAKTTTFAPSGLSITIVKVKTIFSLFSIRASCRFSFSFRHDF